LHLNILRRIEERVVAPGVTSVWHDTAPSGWGAFPGSCELVTVPSAIDDVSALDFDKALGLWVSLVRLGGRLTVGGLDAFALFDAALSGRLTLAQADAALYGEGRQGLRGADEVRAKLEALGIVVDSVELDGLYFTTSGTRHQRSQHAL
jgi:hypothetical protein